MIKVILCFYNIQINIFFSKHEQLTSKYKNSDRVHNFDVEMNFFISCHHPQPHTQRIDKYPSLLLKALEANGIKVS